jgi:hypothetical protein
MDATGKLTAPDGFTYWEYVLIYVDDLLVVSHQANEIMENISALYRLKEDPKTGKCFGKPDHYLGSTVGTCTFHATGQQCWFMSSDEYVAEAVKNVQTKLSEVSRSLKSKVSTPLAPSYWPELDDSALLPDEQAITSRTLLVYCDGRLSWED